MLAACYPRLADGTTLGVKGERLRVHDAFIVRYDATKDMSLSLPAHADTSSMSFTLALNSGIEGSFEGGGTWFRALDAVVDAEIGQAVAFAGPLRHAGSGARSLTSLLSLFLSLSLSLSHPPPPLPLLSPTRVISNRPFVHCSLATDPLYFAASVFNPKPEL
jgi:hypothetical protein